MRFKKQGVIGTFYVVTDGSLMSPLAHAAGYLKPSLPRSKSNSARFEARTRIPSTPSISDG